MFETWKTNGIISQLDVAFPNLKLGSLAKASLEETLNIRDLIRAAKDFGLFPKGKVVDYRVERGKVIFYGRPGLRKFATGPIYRKSHKVITSLQIGKLGAKRALKLSAICSVVVIAIDNYHHLVENEIGKFIVGFGVNVGASAISGTIAYAAAGAVAAGSAVAAPILAGVAVSIAVSYSLSRRVDHYQIKQKLRKLLVEFYNKAGTFVQKQIKNPLITWTKKQNQPLTSTGHYKLLKEFAGLCKSC